MADNFSFRQITLSGNEACAVTIDNHGYCWGNGALGGGDGTETCNSRPCRRPRPPSSGNLEFAMISVADAHACGVTTGGVGYCWGYADLGMLGVPIESCPSSYCSSPVAGSGGHSFTTIQAGNEHTCGLTTDHLIYCWGSNYRWQLGVTTADTSSMPIKVMGQP